MKGIGKWDRCPSANKCCCCPLASLPCKGRQASHKISPQTVHFTVLNAAGVGNATQGQAVPDYQVGFDTQVQSVRWSILLCVQTCLSFQDETVYIAYPQPRGNRTLSV